VPLADPFGRGSLHWIEQIYQSHAIGMANGSAMVVMIVVLVVDGTFYTIPTIGILRGGSFCFRRNLIEVKLLSAGLVASFKQISVRGCVEKGRGLVL
jgi:hypothetical protein